MPSAAWVEPEGRGRDVWPEPWVAVTDAGLASALLAELRREVVEGYPLMGQSLRVLARSEAADDVLFGLDDGAGVAGVHLTWTGETSPRYPRATIFADLKEWQANVPKWD